MKLQTVNIGLAIEQIINERGISKSEFGRKIGVAQQNVNRILERSNIDTDKLVTISEALDFNFFTCFRAVDESVAAVADNGAVAVAGGATAHHITTNATNAGDAILQQKVASLEALLAEKERLITVLLDTRK